MYNRFVEIAQEKGMTPYKIHKLTGISQSTFTAWKQGISTPKHEKLKKIADCLGVSVDYLMTGEEKEKTPPVGEVLTEGELNIVKLYRSLSKEKQPMVDSLVKFVVNTPEDKQQMVINMLNAALGGI